MPGISRRDPFPRKVLIAFGSLIAVSLLAVTAARLSGYNPSQVAPSPAVISRDLRFLDAPDGVTIVKDAADGSTVAALPAGIEGFVRGILRAVSRERRNRQLPADTPFRVSRLADGRLTLTDLGTQKTIELNSFGPTNEGAFAVFLRSSAPVAAPVAVQVAPSAANPVPGPGGSAPAGAAR